MNGLATLFKNPGEPDVSFDDQQIESWLYKNEKDYSPTPADLFRFWLQGRQMTVRMEQALLSVITGKIKLVIDLGKGEEALELLKKNLDSPGTGIIKKIRSLIALWEIYSEKDPLLAQITMNTIRELVAECGDNLDKETMRRWDRICSKTNRVDQQAPYELRSAAYDKFENNDFAGAERIYLKLIGLNFELPGTLCHLARVQLLMNREKDAFNTVTRAWRSKSIALKYVIPRILYLKIFLSMLEGMNFNLWINRLNNVLNDDPDLMQWDIEVVVNAYRERLQDEHYNFMILLAEVLSGNKKCNLLEQFACWPKQKGSQGWG